MIWFLYILAVVAIFMVWFFCRPETIYTARTNKPVYGVINSWTGHFALNGRVFKTEKAAERALKRLISKSWFELDGMTFYIEKLDRADHQFKS